MPYKESISKLLWLNLEHNVCIEKTVRHEISHLINNKHVHKIVKLKVIPLRFLYSNQITILTVKVSNIIAIAIYTNL